MPFTKNPLKKVVLCFSSDVSWRGMKCSLPLRQAQWAVNFHDPNIWEK
jgi:hypothetical protein